MTTKTQRRNGVNRRATKNKSPEQNDNRIPAFISDPVQSLDLRYYVPSSYGSDVLSFTKELPLPPFGISFDSSTVILPFKSIRLKRVKMWCMYRPDKDIAGNTINLTIEDRRLARPIEWSDTASFSCNAFISKKFSKFDPLGQWYLTSSGESNPEIRFQMPKGAVLELTLDYIQSDGQSCRTSSLSSASFPRVYTNQLDPNLACVGKSYAGVLA